MKPRRLPALLCLLAIGVSSLSAQEEQAELEAKLREVVPEASDATSLKIIDKHLQVLGGLGQLKAITNTISKGIKREGKKEVELTITRAAPDKLRMEEAKYVMGRLDRDVRGTNGTAFWTFRPDEKNALPKEMGDKEAALFAKEADFYGPLVDWQEKGYVFRYEGEAKSRGRPHYLLRMFFPNGLSMYFYFDKKTLMVTRAGQEEIIGNSIVDTDTYYTKFERVEGVWMPVQMEFALEDQVYGSLMLNSIKANQPLAADFFDLPKVKEVWLRKN